MTAVRVGLLFLAIGIGALIGGIANRADSDLLHIGGVGCIVFGAVAISISTEAKNNNLPPRVKPVKVSKPPADPPT